MKGSLILAASLTIACAMLTPPSVAAEKKGHGAVEIRKDFSDHRAMAEAHLNAAQCLDSGKSEKVCQEQLGKDCKGLGTGKYCGMKHMH